MKHLQKFTQVTSATSLLLGTLFFLATSCSQAGLGFDPHDDIYSEEASVGQMTTGTDRSTSSYLSSVSSSIRSTLSYAGSPFKYGWYGMRQAWNMGSVLTRTFFGEKYEDFGSEIQVVSFLDEDEQQKGPMLNLDYPVTKAQEKALEDAKWYKNMKQNMKETGFRFMRPEAQEKYNKLWEQEVNQKVARGLTLYGEDEKFYQRLQQEYGGFQGLGDF